MIQENLNLILQEIKSAAAQAERDSSLIHLIAVSKTKPIQLVREAYAAGQVDFGENRVQELVEKHAELPDLHWHMIGNLQRNKVKQIAPFIHLIHSVDSERLLAEIEKQADRFGRHINCLLQINISDESQKGGFSETECAELLSRIADFPNIQILGLMGMAEFTTDTALIRSQFHRLRLAADQFRKLENAQVKMKELSMGMSGDFPIAIAEGATMVRVGSRIFGSRSKL